MSDPNYPQQRGPYGQQPPPYGQPPGQQSDYPQDYPQDYPSAPPGQPVRKGGKKVWLIVGIVVIALVVGVVLYRAMNKDSASKAAAGDCIKVNSAADKHANVEPIDCNDKVAVFKVAKKLGNDTDDCPSLGYPKYSQSGGKGGDFALCLMINANEGDCFNNFQEDQTKLTKVDCTDAEVKVAKVVSGTADEGACGEEGDPLIYPEPATTICLTQP